MKPDELRALLPEAIYPLPVPCDTLESHERHTHADLTRRPRADLARELERVTLRLLLDDDPDPWLLVRAQKIRERLQAR